MGEPFLPSSICGLTAERSRAVELTTLTPLGPLGVHPVDTRFCALDSRRQRAEEATRKMAQNHNFWADLRLVMEYNHGDTFSVPTFRGGMICHVSLLNPAHLQRWWLPIFMLLDN